MTSFGCRSICAPYKVGVRSYYSKLLATETLTQKEEDTVNHVYAKEMSPIIVKAPIIIIFLVFPI